MTNEELLADFEVLLRDLLFDESVVLTMETKRKDVSNWDSFQYVNFIVGVEAQFDIKFRVADVESFETVGDIVKEAQSLLSQ
jgi:acyl carrier protein